MLSYDMVWYAMRFQCYAMRFVYFALVYVVNDKHSATVWLNLNAIHECLLGDKKIYWVIWFKKMQYWTHFLNTAGKIVIKHFTENENISNELNLKRNVLIRVIHSVYLCTFFYRTPVVIY